MSARNAARAIADLTRGMILATVDISVPPERVFEALTTQELTQWWGSADTYRVTSYEADLRVGGRWLTRGMGNDGKPFSVGGEFLEIDRPRLLVQTWKADWDGGHVTTIRYQLDSLPEGTRVTVRHEGFGDRVQSCQGHANGWERVLGWLAGHFLEATNEETGNDRPAGDKPLFFLCRLIGPRPTFPFDMTPDEAKIMQEHGAYWREHLAAGTVIVFGPVADPQGPWGLGVLRVKSADEVAKLEQGDPVIKSNRGFRYEVLPMMTAVY
jgi:uncharacterized protein YndB with AHSA1/START domain